MIRHVIPPIPAELLAEVPPWVVAQTADATSRGILRAHVIQLLEELERGHRDGITARLGRMVEEYGRWARVVAQLEASAAEWHWEAA